MRWLAMSMVLAAAPAAWGQEALPDKVLANLKDATVFVRSIRGLEQITGSGFVLAVAGQDVTVVSNAHTIAFGPNAADSIRLVFRSGTAKEKVVDATVVARDDTLDLSVLRARLADPPAPLSLAVAPKLRETMPVLMLGYPFGEALALVRGNPAVTVSKGSISSLRTDEYGNLAVVQLDGDLNPGNSGGPVVTPDGSLIGVSVAKISGTQIGFAIPLEHLRSVLNGRVAKCILNEKQVKDGKSHIDVTVNLVDPLARTMAVAILVVEHDQLPAAAKPDATGRWGPASPKMVEHALKVAGSSATGQIVLDVAKDRRRAYAFQVKRTDLAGKVSYTAADKFFVAASDESAGGRLSSDDGWLGERKVDDLPNELAKPESPGGVLAGTPFKSADATVIPLTLDGKTLLPFLVWSAGGNSFFILDKAGLLREVSLPDLVERRRLNLGTPAVDLKRSSEGLVVLAVGRQEVWLIDERSLTVKRRIPVPEARTLAASPASNLAFVLSGRNPAGLAIISLSAGKILTRATPLAYYEQAGKTRKRHKTSGVSQFWDWSEATADGKFLIMVSEGTLHRFAVKGQELEYEEASPKLAESDVVRIAISPDSQYVALVCGGGDAQPADHPQIGTYGTYIYRIGDLQTPAMSVRQGAYPRALAFDKQAKLLYSQNSDSQLLTFRVNGTQAGRYQWGRGRDEATLSLWAHPQGHKVLVLTEYSLYLVELPRP